MKKSLLVAVAACVHVAFGEIYTWQGTDGLWNKAANWSPNTPTETGPGAGDVALFTANAVITDDIAIGEGQLAISNAASTTVELKGVISGAGDLVKGDDGSLKLYGDNTFTGKFISNGTGNGNADPRDSSLVTIFHPNALGRTKAEFDQNQSYYLGRGSRLFIDGSLYPGEFVMTIPLAVSGDQPSNYNIVLQNCTALTFEKQVTSKLRLAIKSDKDHYATVWLKEGYAAGNYNFFQYGDFHFQGPVNGTFYPSEAVQEVFLYSDQNTYGNMTFGNPVHLMVENALRANANASYTFNSGTAVLNFHGHDQTIGVLNSAFSEPGNKTTHGFTSPEDEPAVLHLKGTVATIPQFHGAFTGAAGLEWAPTDATREFVFSNAVQTTKGSFTVTTGTIRFKNGAGTTQLGALNVGETGAVVVEPSATDLVLTGGVTVAAGGTISLGADRKIRCRRLTVGGEEKGTGEYAAADLPDMLGTSEGMIVVNPYVDNAWQGGAYGVWSEGANWAQGHAPTAEENAVIDGKVTVAVTDATAAIADLRLTGGATLVFSNSWNACVNADAVSVVGSTVTCAGPFSNETAKCRVWFKCRRFDLGADATIDVNGRGWMGGTYARIWGDWDNDSNKNYNTRAKNDDGVSGGGWGPGRANLAVGASHFGYGASRGGDAVATKTMSQIYDDPFAPTEPGSGGFGLQGSAYGVVYNDPTGKTTCPSGGGAVWIDATGPVTVNGKILANGVSSFVGHFHYCNNPSYESTGGSGGSVRIVCETIAGAGEIRANGGDGGHSIFWPRINVHGMSSSGVAGGGGGIAISYDTAKQEAGACAAMTVSAGAGTYPDMPNQTGAKKTERLDYGKMGKYRHDAEPGTVYFSDNKLVDDLIGHGLTGKLFNVPEYVYEGDLDWTWGNVRFGATGAVFKVVGNLSVSGNWSRVDVGGATKRNDRGTRPYVCSPEKAVKLEVTGDLTVADGASLSIYAADTADESGYGGEVKVAGKLTIGNDGIVHPTADYFTGVAPTFTVGSLEVAAGGRLDADRRGFSGAWNSGDYETSLLQATGCGPGGGSGSGGGQGAGYGGLGGLAFYKGSCTTDDRDRSRGVTYGDAFEPVLAGSGGGCNGYGWGGDGGGVIRVIASGAIDIAGTVTANGSFEEQGQHHCGGGSGGSVCLVGATVTCAETATVSAKGACSAIVTDYPSWVDAPGKTVTASVMTQAGGAGGRIAIWTGNDVVGKRSVRRGKGLDDPLFADKLSLAALPTVEGGKTVNFIPEGNNVDTASWTERPVIESSWGRDGTVTYNCFIEAPGALMFVR